jgi:hypothetical protein
MMTNDTHFLVSWIAETDWRLGLESSERVKKKGPFAKATRFAGADAAVRSHGRDG